MAVLKDGSERKLAGVTSEKLREAFEKHRKRARMSETLDPAGPAPDPPADPSPQAAPGGEPAAPQATEAGADASESRPSLLDELLNIF
jgi:hypothetical protein